jgi:hypothetical protein
MELKAQRKGTYTDAKGEVQIQITTEKTLLLTLEVRSVGFKTKSVHVYQWEDTPVNIDLESKIGGSLCADRIRHHCRSQTDVTLLQNVLAIGYGTTTKEKTQGRQQLLTQKQVNSEQQTLRQAQRPQGSAGILAHCQLSTLPTSNPSTYSKTLTLLPYTAKE